MKNQETAVLVFDKLEEIRRQKEKEYSANLESLRETHPDLEIVQPTEDEGFWAAGYITIQSHGVYVDVKGNFTCKEHGDFHMDGRYYGLFVGGEAKGAVLLCVLNTVPEHFFNTDMASTIDITGVATGIYMTWYGVPLANITGPSFGCIGGGGGTIRATLFNK